MASLKQGENILPPRKDKGGWRKICVMHRASIGDTLLATPVYRAIKECFPSCRVVLVTSYAGAEMLYGNPYIDKLIAYKKGESPASVIRAMWRADAAVVLDMHYRNAFFAFLAMIPRRIGRGRNFLTERVSDDSPTTFEPLKYLKIVRTLGIDTDDLTLYRPTATPEEKQRINEILAVMKGQRKKLALIAPYSLDDVKNWPPARYRRIMELLEQNDTATVVIGGEDCRERIERDFPGANSLVGLTNLRESAQCAAMADLVICGCASMLHIASATGAKTLALYGPTVPTQWAPRKNCTVITKNFPCSPCYNTDRACKPGENRCLLAIEVEEVWQAAQKILGNTA